MDQRIEFWYQPQKHSHQSCIGHLNTGTETLLQYAMVHPVIIKKPKCLFNIQYGFLWVDGWVGGIIAVIVIIIIMCKSVSAAQSVGKEQGRA